MNARPAQKCSSSAGWADQLRRDGYLVVRGAMPAGQLELLSAELDGRFERTPFCEGLFNGYRTKRFHGLLKRSRGAAALALHPQILAAAEGILSPFCDKLQLNLTQAVEIHPGELAQIPHRDQGMWGGEKGRIEYMLNVMWPLSSYTAANGSTRIWPGSHLRQSETDLPAELAIAPEMAPGDALLFLGSTLHGAGANLTRSVRRGVVISYCLGWLKPYENMWLTYPPAIARRFSPRLQELVGYCQHRPNLGNYDGQCPSVLLQSRAHDYAPTRDAVAPAHEPALRAFAALQRAEFPMVASG